MNGRQLAEDANEPASPVVVSGRAHSHRLLQIIMTIGALQSVAILLTVFRSKATAVLLGPAGVGAISIIDQIVQSAAYLSALSVPLIATKFLARAHSEGPSQFHTVYTAFLKALLILSACGTAIVSLLVLLRPRLLGPEIAALKGPLLTASLGIPGMILGGYFVTVLASAQKPKASSVMAILSNAAITCGAVSGIFIAGVRGLYTGTLVAGLLFTVGTLFYFAHSLGLTLTGSQQSMAAVLRRHRDAGPLALILYTITCTYSLSLLVLRFTVLKHQGIATTGIFQATLTLAGALALALNPASATYLMPLVNRSLPVRDKIAATEDFQARFLSIVGLGCIVLALFSRTVLTLLYSGKFSSGAEFLYLFICGNFLFLAAGVLQCLLIGLDDLKFFGFATSAGHIVIALLGTLLVAPLGLGGAGIAFLAGQLATFSLCSYRLHTHFQMRFRGLNRDLVIFHLACVLAVGWLFRNVTALSLYSLCLRVGVFLVFSCGLVSVLWLHRPDAVAGIWTALRRWSFRPSQLP